MIHDLEDQKKKHSPSIASFKPIISKRVAQKGSFDPALQKVKPPSSISSQPRSNNLNHSGHVMTILSEQIDTAIAKAQANNEIGSDFMPQPKKDSDDVSSKKHALVLINNP